MDRRIMRARLAALAQRAATRRKRTRQRAIEILGGCCQCCGETEPRFLQFDHVAPRGGALDRKTLGVSQTMLVNRVAKGERAGEIQLLCANCHLVKTLGEPCPHQKEPK